MDIKSSDFILILKLEDIHGEKMRVADTAEFTVRVWTNDPTHYWRDRSMLGQHRS